MKNSQRWTLAGGGHGTKAGDSCAEASSSSCSKSHARKVRGVERLDCRCTKESGDGGANSLCDGGVGVRCPSEDAVMACFLDNAVRMTPSSDVF